MADALPRRPLPPTAAPRLDGRAGAAAVVPAQGDQHMSEHKSLYAHARETLNESAAIRSILCSALNGISTEECSHVKYSSVLDSKINDVIIKKNTIRFTPHAKGSRG